MESPSHLFVHIRSTATILSDRFLITFILMLSLCCTGFLSQTQVAYAQINHDCYGSHCYGVNDWPGAIDGARTYVTVRGFSDIDPADSSFIDNEMWLINTLCQNSQSYWDWCWVEGGYQATGPAYSPYPNIEDWFWAEQYAPSMSNPSSYYECDDPNPLNNDPGGNSDYGHNVYINLYRTATRGNWGIVIQGNRTSWSTNGSTCTYFSFLMSPNLIQIGQEVNALKSTNVTAPHANFTGNQWEYTNFGPYKYQTYDGIQNDNGVDSNHINPAWSGWNTGQDPPHSSTGGSWYTCTLPSNGQNPC